MPNGISHDAPMEKQYLYRADFLYHVSLKYTRTPAVFLEITKRLVLCFEVLIEKLIGFVDTEFLVSKYPEAAEAMDAYRFLKDVMGVDVASIVFEKSDRSFNFELKGEKVKLSIEEVGTYLQKTRLFWKFVDEKVLIQ
ncbi:hypothetical protein KY328_01470 [Candidatus Woesearchaeota archaeon]|nr:hypothetical protein [Candidatus Woesearchaeota archaeon]